MRPFAGHHLAALFVGAMLCGLWAMAWCQPHAVAATPTGRIVWVARNYLKQGQSSFDLWVMNADGSGKRRLTRTPDEERRPLWSPDGRKIAFLRGDGLWLIDRNGGGQRRLVSAGHIEDFHWSPTGEYIAFLTYRGWFLLDLRQGSTRSLGDGWLTWRPNGREALLVRQAPDGGQICLVKIAEGGLAQPIGRLPEGFIGGVWSPDTTRLAATLALPPDGYDSRLLILDAHGGVMKEPVAASGDRSGVMAERWLSSTNLLLYRHMNSTDGDQVSILDLSSGKEQRLKAPVGGAQDVSRLVWSPDSQYVIQVTSQGRVQRFGNLRVSHNHLILARPDGQKMRGLTEQVSVNKDPDWWMPRKSGRNTTR